MKNPFKKTTIILLSIIIVIALLHFSIPDYISKAIIYQRPNLTDYKIFKNRDVKAGKTRPWPLSGNYNRSELPKELSDTLTRLKTTAFLVIHHDSILFETYQPPFSNTSHSNAFSMTKSLVGLLVGCALQEGKIRSLDDKVKQYLPHLRGPYSDSLCIHHLLTMSSGSSWDESYNSLFSLTTRAYYGQNLDKTIKKVTIISPPGHTFSYRSGDTQLLANILTEATGKTLAQYTSEKLWQPLEAEHDALWSLDHSGGMEKAYCCFNSNARDFARLGTLILNKGQWQQQQLVSETYITKSITPATHLKDNQGNTVNYYGLQWWIMHYKGLTIPYARGILGQYIFVLSEQDAIIVRLGHKRSKNRRGKHPSDAFTWIDLGLRIIEQN